MGIFMFFTFGQVFVLGTPLCDGYETFRARIEVATAISGLAFTEIYNNAPTKLL